MCMCTYENVTDLFIRPVIRGRAGTLSLLKSPASWSGVVGPPGMCRWNRRWPMGTDR